MQIDAHSRSVPNCKNAFCKDLQALSHRRNPRRSPTKVSGQQCQATGSPGKVLTFTATATWQREKTKHIYNYICLFIYIWCMYIYNICSNNVKHCLSSWWNNSKHADCSRSVLHSDELSRGVSPNTRSDHFQILIVLYSSWIVFSLVSLASCIPLD